MIKKTELHDLETSELKPYFKNPRKNNEAVKSVKKSLEEYGLIKNSIVVDENMELIAGHTTLKAIISLGWLTVPEVTQVFGLSEAQKKGYRLADNRTGEDAEWDDDLLEKELQELEDQYTGFNEDELDEIEQNQIPYDLDELIEELNVKYAIETPIWIVIRAPESMKSKIEEILAELDNEIHIEKSYKNR